MNNSIIEAHLSKIRSAYADKIKLEQDGQKQKNKIIIAALIFCSLCVGLLYVLLPLKQVQPVLAIVDGQNGIVKSVEYEKPDSKISNNVALVKSYAWSYVVDRYSYEFSSADQLKERYSKVLIFTGKSLREGFENEVSKDNPSSPYAIYGNSGHIKIKEINVIPMSGDRVQVNFTSEIINAMGTIKTFSYTAIGKYEWEQYDGLDVKDRYLNPFGFVFSEWNLIQNSSNDANKSSIAIVSETNNPTTTNTTTNATTDSITQQGVSK